MNAMRSVVELHVASVQERVGRRSAFENRALELPFPSPHVIGYMNFGVPEALRRLILRLISLHTLYISHTAVRIK